ncbi:hypothetical protein DFH28DRAFT_576116 [Melampsora americana]|nr:hypothetical protein DFH28DRAFT_576116 [Melampsora americana]
MLQHPNPNQNTIPHLTRPQEFASGNWTLTPNSSNSLIEPKPEVRSEAQGEEAFEVQAPPPLSTLPVKVMAAIGVIFLLLTCSLLVYKFIQDWRRQEATSKEAYFMDIDHNRLHGEKGMISSQPSGTQISISKPDMIHFGSHVPQRATYGSQKGFINPDEKPYPSQHFSYSSSVWNDNMDYDSYPPGYEEPQESIESYYRNHNSDTKQIPEFPINLDILGFTGTRCRKSFVLNFNPYHHWERAMNLQTRDLNHLTQAMSSPNRQFYNDKSSSPFKTKTSASHESINMDESRIVEDEILPVPQHQVFEPKSLNSQSDQSLLNEDQFYLESVEQKVDYVSPHYKFLSIHSDYDIISNMCDHNRKTFKHKSVN